MVTTRKRGTPAAEAPSKDANKRQRRDQQASPPIAPAAAPLLVSPSKSRARPSPLPKGRRGLALLAAAGGAILASTQPTVLASPPNLSSSRKHKAEEKELSPQRQSPHRHSSPPSAALLKQTLPKTYTTLEEFFSALQLNYGTLRKRGQRCTYQTLRAAVEEQTNRRFLVSHLTQLQYMLPDVISVDYVRLPVAPHSSRTEPHLALTIGPMPDKWDHPAAVPAKHPQKLHHQQQQEEGEHEGAAAETGPSPQAAAKGSSRTGVAPDGEVGLLRQLLHYRLAQHLLGAYRQHLLAAAEKLRDEGDLVAAEAMEAQILIMPDQHAAPADSSSPKGSKRPRKHSKQQKPVVLFASGFLDVAPEVPHHPLPLRPDQVAATSSAAASPAALVSQLAMPDTPASTVAASTRPPLPPSSAVKGQRRLSFGAVAPAVPGPVGFTPRLPFKSTKAGGTPLDKLEKQVMESSGPRGLFTVPECQQQLDFDEEEEQFNGCILTEEEFRARLSDDKARVFDSLPEVARRMSVEGILSIEAHMAVEAASQQHRMSTSKDAVEARALRNALGMLPKTFTRVQRIFGVQGPNALKLQEVITRIRSADETFSAEEVEQQLQLLAEHAPECFSLRPYGRCGTPAAWWNRRAERANGTVICQRLKALAEARQSLAPAPAAATVV